MKITCFIAALAALSLAACSKEKQNLPTPRVLTGKTVNFSIYQAADYSDPAFDGVLAELKLAVSKVQKSSGQLTTLWDSTVAFQSLRDYPRLHQPASVTRNFPGINDDSETLQASYHIRYKDAQNQVSGKGKNDFAGIGASVLTLPVRL